MSTVGKKETKKKRKRAMAGKVPNSRTTPHSPTTFFGISISSDFRPSVRSDCRMRWSFSVSVDDRGSMLCGCFLNAPCMHWRPGDAILHLMKRKHPNMLIRRTSKSSVAAFCSRSGARDVEVKRQIEVAQIRR